VVDWLDIDLQSYRTNKLALQQGTAMAMPLGMLKDMLLERVVEVMEPASFVEMMEWRGRKERMRRKDLIGPRYQFGEFWC
jgi:hypothetical protein